MTENKQYPQRKQLKEPYTTPELMVYGDVEELTRGGGAIRPGDANSTPLPPEAPRRATPTPTRKP